VASDSPSEKQLLPSGLVVFFIGVYHSSLCPLSPGALSAPRTQSDSLSYTTLPILAVLELLYSLRTPSFTRVLSSSGTPLLEYASSGLCSMEGPLFDGGRARPEAEK
jgi:hypothetical protein